MSLAIYFEQKCLSALEENISLTLKKLTAPLDVLIGDISLLLSLSAEDVLGSISKYARDYIKDQSDKMALYLIQALGVEEFLRQVMDTVYNLFALAYLLYDTFVLYMLKVLARKIISFIDKKDAILVNVRGHLVELHNCLFVLSKGDPVYEEYLQNIRDAYAQLAAAERGVGVVRSSLSRPPHTYLSNTYSSAQKAVDEAIRLLQGKPEDETINPPPVSVFVSGFGSGGFGVGPYGTGGDVAFLTGSGFGYGGYGVGGYGEGEILTQSSGTAYTKPAEEADESYFSTTQILASYGVPVKKQQINNILAVPRISWYIINDMEKYSAYLAAINGLLATYIQGTALIATALNDNLIKYSTSLLTQIQSDIKEIKDEMPPVYKTRVVKNTNRFTGIVQTKNYQPVPSTVASHVVKWLVLLSSVQSRMKLLPIGALASPRIDAGRADIAMFELSVETLLTYDDVGTGQAKLEAVDAQEKISGFEQQLLTLMLQANSSITTAKVGTETLSLARSMISRLDLTANRDADIKRTLTTFIDYPLRGEAELKRIMDAINDLLEMAGLDRALSLLDEGKLDEFFKMSPTVATFVGAGLQAIALLKQCSKNQEDANELTKVQRELERDQDLVNAKIGFDFDAAIRANLDLCLRVRGLSGSFDLKEFLCSLKDSLEENPIFQSLKDVVSF